MTPCKDCRFWQHPKDNYTRPPDEYSSYGRCTLGDSADGYPDQPETLAFAADMESYQAVLFTSPDFGCVQGQNRADLLEHITPDNIHPE